MPRIITDLELETGPEREQVSSCSPRRELEPFKPALFDGIHPERRLVEWSTHLGTYGMGGPGFVGFKFDDGQWLVVTIWCAGNWVWGREKGKVGRPLERDDRVVRPNGRAWPEPWYDYNRKPKDELSPHIVGQTTKSFRVDHRSMELTLANGFQLFVAEDPAKRQSYPAAGPRAFEADDDLRQGLILSPTNMIWV